MSLKPALSLLKTSNLPILEQLQLEEALLRADQRNWCLINQGSPSAIVMGISGEPERLINPHIFQEKKLPIIRRFSGGGTVIVDEETLFISFICSPIDTGIPCYPLPVLQWTERFYQPLFGEKFRLNENDYVLGNRKFGGNAQYFKKDRWLHHSSLLWDYNKKNMEYLLLPPKMPKYREMRSHQEFLCTLKEHGGNWNKELFQKRVIQEMEKHFTLHFETLERTKTILKSPHRKSTTLVEWN